ncbi:MAG: hypothetical protein K8L91_00230, partial [Anaerolineae bacterium]|nr:hypothetical protein [Anaerolineae bacterium]
MNPILKRGLTLGFILLIGLLAITPLPRAAHSQNPAPQRIESDDPSVTRAGNWTSQTASQASGGSYLYSSGADDDVLTLQFSGPSVEVIFVAGPSLGTLAISVDDVVLRTVITTADQTAYQQSSRIDYLSDEPHTLKVYAQAGGVVGIDAFVVPTSPPDPLSASSEGETSGQPRDGLGSGNWMATYVQLFPTAATCSPPDLDLMNLPSGSVNMGTYPTAEINFDWSNNSAPSYVSPTTDLFAIEFRRTVTFSENTTLTINYMFDDGIRMYDNGTRFVNWWGCSVGPYSIMRTFTAGTHELVIQYYENTGSANIVVRFQTPALTATRQSNTQINLAWNDVLMGETNYRVERSPDGVSNWSEIATLSATTTAYQNTGLSCGTYYYRVRGYFSSSSSYSLYSNVANAVALPCPETPSNLNATTLDDERIQLNWVDNAADESAYLVERSLDGSTNWMLVATLAANTQTFSNRLLDCGTTYHYRVRAYRQADSAYSSYSNVAFNTTGACPVSCTHDPRVYRVSENASGIGGNDGSGVPDISDSGRYVAFQSWATNYVAGDTNSQVDVFVKDTVTCQVWRISMTSDGQQANAASYAPRISPNGRYIAFFSPASNLVAGDNNGNYDAFVVDRLLGQITLLASYNGAIPTTGSMGGVVSDNGIAAFYAVGSFAGLGPLQYALVRDLNTGVISVVSLDIGGQPQSAGGELSISPDGRYVAFTTATGLVGGDTNGQGDVYLRDRQANTTTWVSVGHFGQQGVGNSMIPSVSPNGRYVSFDSTAENLVNNDTNLFRDVFLRDVQQSTTIRVSVSATGTQANNVSSNSAVDNNGVVYYTSSATTIVPGTSIGENQIYRYDPSTQQVTIMSRASNGTLGNGSSFSPRISSNGRFLTFESTAYNLDPDDAAGGYPDVFAVDMTILLAPSNLTALWSCATKDITLSWIDTNTDETNYLIERSTTGTGGWSQIAAVAANVVTYSNSSLPTGTQFYYRVRAYRASDTTYTGYSDLATATTQICPPAAPNNVTAAHLSQTSIRVNWIDNANDETNFTIERSFNGTTDWSQIGSTVANVRSFTDTVYLTCGTTYYYRVRAYRSGDGVFSAYSDVASAFTTACLPDTLALVNPATRSANLFRTLDNSPAGSDFVQFATGLPFGPGGQYVMGDWDGDGVDTIGVYREGAFYFTNDFGTGGTWGGIWFGLGGQAVVGRFDATVNHDCLGVTDSGIWTNGDTYFALYFTCNLTSGPTPPLTFQWLSIVLPNSQGFTGAFQFVAGDFNGDGVDSVAIRRGAFIAWTNVPPTTLLSQFSLAQYFGAPGTGDEGKVVAGDWDRNNVDSFGLVYQNGTFYRRNDVEWNTGVYILQTFTPSIGTPFDVA